MQAASGAGSRRFEDAGAVDDARQPVGQHDQHGADAGQQEYRRDRDLDDVADVCKLDVQAGSGS